MDNRARKIKYRPKQRFKFSANARNRSLCDALGDDFSREAQILSRGARHSTPEDVDLGSNRKFYRLSTQGSDCLLQRRLLENRVDRRD